MNKHFRKLLIESIVAYGPITKETLKTELEDVYNQWVLADETTAGEINWKLQYAICEKLRSEPSIFSELISRYKNSTDSGESDFFTN